MLCALDKCRYYVYNESMTNNNTTKGNAMRNLLVKADKIDKLSTLARYDGRAVVMVKWGQERSEVRGIGMSDRTFYVMTNDLQVF